MLVDRVVLRQRHRSVCRASPEARGRAAGGAWPTTLQKGRARS